MRKTKKAIASLAIAGMVLSMAPLSVFGATTTNRLGGAGRVETAIAIAAQGWTASDSVIVVPADDANVVDALAAAPLAGQLNAPILVTYKGALDPQVQAEIVKLGAKKVYAVGALSADTVASLKAISGVTVTALQGADRTETAAKVAAQLTGVKGSFVVAYEGKADALSAASFAAANDYSIVIANPDGTIPASETVVAPTYTVGGQVTVAGATALYGADRYATNNAVVDGLDFDFDTVYVANGQSLVDALAGAPLAAQTNSPIVLGDAVGVATGANDDMTSSSKVIALGGVGAVSDGVLAKVAYEAPATLAVESVSAINSKQIEVKFSKAVDEDSVVVDADDTLVNDLMLITRLPAGSDTNKIIEADDLYASLSKDGETLTLTAPGTFYFDGTYAVSIVDDEILSEDRAESISGYTTSFKVDDTTAPTVTSVTYKPATSQVEVVMSEPVIVKPAIRVDGATEAVTADGVVDGADGDVSDTFLVNIDTDLAGETVTIKVSGAQDYSRNVMTAYEKSVKLSKEEGDVEVVSLEQKNSNTVTVKFNRAIDGDDATDAETIVTDSLKVMSGVTEIDIISVDRDSDDNTMFDVALTLDPATGPDWFYGSDKSSATLTFYFTEGMLEDVYSNTNSEEITKSIRVTKDVAGPKILSSRVVNSEKEIRIQFDQDLAAFSAVDASTKNIELRKSGVAVTSYAKVAADSDELVLTVNAAGTTAFADGSYTVRITKGTTEYLADQSGNKVSTQTYGTITVDDGDTSSVEVLDIANDTGDNVFIVQYDGEVGLSALEPANYSLDGVALPDNTDIYFSATLASGAYTASDKEEVTILLQSGAVNYDATDSVLTVIGVKDSDGNRVDVSSSDSDLVVADNTAAKLINARLIGNNTLILEFNEDVDQATDFADLAAVAAEFSIKRGTIELGTTDGSLANSVVSTAVDGDTITITVTDAGDDITSASSWTKIAASGGVISVETIGVALADANGVVVDDDIKVTAARNY